MRLAGNEIVRPEPFSRNILLSALALEDYEDLRRDLEPVPLNEGHLILAQGDRISFVCFPESGVTSMASVLPDGTRTEVALIGREGMTNSQLLLGCDRAAHEATVQVGKGSLLRLEADRLAAFCARRPSAHMLFLRFAHALAVQTACTLTSNLRDPAEKRLSRWLLMCHDRVDGDEIRLTHEHIGRMLGVRRATVTDTLHVLEGRGAVRSRRGCVFIRDRLLLEALAGSSYGFAEGYYAMLIGSFGKGRARPPQELSQLPLKATMPAPRPAADLARRLA